jgi:hypothetical protein
MRRTVVACDERDDECGRSLLGGTKAIDDGAVSATTASIMPTLQRDRCTMLSSRGLIIIVRVLRIHCQHLLSVRKSQR